MLEIAEGLSIQRDHIAVVRSVDDGKSCVIFTVGQSAVDGGFLIKERYDAVMDHLHGPESDALEAADVLLKVLDQAAPFMQRIATTAADAGDPYAGPNFASEMDDLRIALKQAE